MKGISQNCGQNFFDALPPTKLNNPGLNSNYPITNECLFELVPRVIVAGEKWRPFCDPFVPHRGSRSHSLSLLTWGMDQARGDLRGSGSVVGQKGYKVSQVNAQYITDISRNL